ncbi:heavy metal sensor histidine kinase [Pseudomonas stutzeri]|uniref:heavy metal sensor histidine kinase n=1 Tax=Stutzerimonas stutzeri TaxID=316 RepID=UPI002109D9A8|nr:heavy metal sensor histidine kinase [Stutzerimonas stutzeri]MCQ4312005.1 heavy metal sensor histidine kinase [Stutzerimonas stutzeri]
MKRLSLTARLSLMFMLAVTGVLGAAGYFFNQMSQHHFDELDRHTLEEKFQATRSLLQQLDGLAQFDELRPQLQALLGGHSELSVRIFDAQGRLLFADAGAVPPVGAHVYPAADSDGEVQHDGRVWRSRTGSVAAAGQSLRVVLALDVTTHKVFFHTLTGWLWGALMLCALISGVLGWLLARSGLRPLREVTQVAASVSVKSLTERIPTESTPAELQQLVLAFNAMLTRLEDAFVRLSNFSADIAHELRTPLSNLMTHTEVVLTRARSSEDYQENLYSNLEELRRMARMIDDMLFLAKADNGLVTPQVQLIELKDLCGKLLDFYQLTADEHGIRFELSGSGRIEGDPSMLHRALSNLLSNALRYTADGGVIRLSIEAGAKDVLLSIGNPGATIPEEHLPRLFDRFYRVDPARREGSPSNAGLGLAITRSIIEAHRGEIRCRSHDGWTSFDIVFRL